MSPNSPPGPGGIDWNAKTEQNKLFRGEQVGKSCGISSQSFPSKEDYQQLSQAAVVMLIFKQSWG